MKQELNDRQAAFVAAYVIHRNATKAAIEAGYSQKTASSQGERLLRNAEVRSAVDAALAKVADRAEVSAERVIRERARLAFFDVRKLLDDDGNPLPLQDLDDDSAAAIAGLDVATSVSEDGSVKTTVRKYRFATKEPNLSALEKRLGLDQKPIRFVLPDTDTAQGIDQAARAVLQAVADGQLLPGEGQALAALVESRRKAFETQELERRIAVLETRNGKA